jgi:hypothetical protein
MKVQELIAQLQEIAKSRPQAEVTFQFADVDAGGILTRAAHLLDIDGEVPSAAGCLITFGNRERDAALYKEHVETLRQQGR